MRFSDWLENKHPEYFNEFFGMGERKLGPKEPPSPPLTELDTADFNPSYKDSRGRIYMPHHHYYIDARQLYKKMTRKRL